MVEDLKSFRLFDFQIRDGVLNNENTSSGSSGGSSKKDKKKMIIQMFGVNERGETCSISLNDHDPFFYVKVPDLWGFDAKTAFISDLKKAAGHYYEDSILDTRSKLIKRKKLYGFDGGKNHKFIMLKFKNLATFNKIKKLWYNKNEKLQLYKGTQLYEANIPPLLRFFHMKDMSPSGWIKILNGDPVPCEQKNTTCTYEYILSCDDFISQPEKEAAVPYKILSFDIEASSSHGDFPIPIKTYKKLASEIVDVCLKDASSITYSEVLRMLQTAFYHDSPENAMFTMHPDICKIFPKKKVNESEVASKFERMWNEPIKRLVEESEPKIVHINTIERMFEKQKEAASHDKETDSEMDEDDETHSVYTRTSNSVPPAKYNMPPSTSTISEILRSLLDRETKINYMNNALQASFPEVEGDKITFIGSTFIRCGEPRPYLNHCLVLNQCDTLAGVQIKCCKSEKNLLLEWTKLVQIENPDIVIGYNTFGFDYNFMFCRAQENKIEEAFLKLSRNVDELCGKRDFKTGRIQIEETSILLASGQYDLHYIGMTGRLQIDLYNYFRREYNLSTYKLDYVGSYFIGDSVSSIEHRIEADCMHDGKVTRIFSNNITGLDVGNFVEFEETGHCSEPYKDGKKFMVISINRDNHYFEIGGHESPDLKKNVRWGLSKDDITPQDIFRMTNEGPKERSIVAKYCIQDCNIVHHLMKKVDVLTGYNEMAKICSVPVSFLVTRGQGIKLTSYMAKKCREKRVLIPVIDKGSSEEGYEGAIVLQPKRGLYLDNPVACNDYSSLYPSSMISENLSHDSKVWTKEYDINGTLTHETGEKDSEGNHIYDNLPEYTYVNVEYDTYTWTPNSRGKLIKKLSGKKICRFAQCRDGTKAILPSILEELLSARKSTRKLAEQQTDPFMANVLDKRQNAYKITANSLYGQCGAKTSSFYEIDVAASTTATGRKLLTYAKRMVETVYGNAIIETKSHGSVKTNAEYVYGDTDSVFYTFNLQTIDGIPIRGKSALEITIDLAKQVGHLASSFLKSPHAWVYEKTLMPFGILQKKRYFGILYENDPNKGKPKSMGIVLKRRDNAPIVKEVYGGLIDILTKRQNLQEALSFVKNSLQTLVNEEVPIDKLIITKSLRSNYKNPKQIAHKVLADRIGKRDPGNKPSSGDRIPFAYIHSPNKKALQGDLIETPDFIKKSNLKLNYSFYITNQIMKPVAQLLALVLEEIPEFKRKKARFLNEIEDLTSNWQDTEEKLQKKIEDIRINEIKILIFDEYLRQADNLAKSNKSIKDFFKKT